MRPLGGQRRRQDAVFGLRERRVAVPAEAGKGGPRALQDKQPGQTRLDGRAVAPPRDPGRAPIGPRSFERGSVETVPEPLLDRDLDQ